MAFDGIPSSGMPPPANVFVTLIDLWTYHLENLIVLGLVFVQIISSLPRFRNYWVHKISMVVAAWPWPLTPWPWKPVQQCQIFVPSFIQIRQVSAEISRHQNMMLSSYCCRRRHKN